MTINIIQTISNLLDEKRRVIKSSTVESTVLTPAQGKVLKHIPTGKIFTQAINIGTAGKIKDYIEIDSVK